MKKITALLITLLLLSQTFAFAATVDVKAEGESIANYYKTSRTDLELSDETFALAAAGVDLKGNPVTSAPIDEDKLETDFAGTASKLILTAIAKGENPKTCVAGRNIVDELAASQGTDGGFGSVYTHIYAVVALKACGKAFDEEKAAQFIISKQLSDGGYSYNDQLPGDIDTTAMLLSVMAVLKDETGMNDCIDKAVAFVLSNQNSLGGFESWGADNANSLAVAIIGLTDCGIDVTKAEYKNMPQALLRFKNPDSSYRYGLEDEQTNNPYATPQVLIAFDALKDGESYFLTLAKTGKYNKPVEAPSSISQASQAQTNSNTTASQKDETENAKTADSLNIVIILMAVATIFSIALTFKKARFDSK